jgi:hypothetical protein
MSATRAACLPSWDIPAGLIRDCVCSPLDMTSSWLARQRDKIPLRDKNEILVLCPMELVSRDV